MRTLLHYVALAWSVGAILMLAVDWHGKQPEGFTVSNGAIGIIAALVAIATKPTPVELRAILPSTDPRVSVARGDAPRSQMYRPVDPGPFADDR